MGSIRIGVKGAPHFITKHVRSKPTYLFIYLSSRRLFLEAARPEPSSVEEYTTCVENKNSLVISEVFCLPQDYRKDVPPPSEYIHIQCRVGLGEVK